LEILISKNMINLSEIFEIVFKEQVLVDVSIFEKSMNGFRNTQSIKNITAQIIDDTICLKNKDNNVFFKMVRLRVNDESIFLQFTKPYLNKIECGGDMKFDTIENFGFSSKSKLDKFKKIVNRFEKNKTFFNARKIIIYLTKFTPFYLSSEFGFDGIRVRIIDIKEPNFASNIRKNAKPILEKKQKELIHLMGMSNDIQTRIKKIKDEINRINSYI